MQTNGDGPHISRPSWDDNSALSASHVVAQIDAAAEFLRGKLPASQANLNVAIVCGSGLSNIASRLTDLVEIPYEDIPFFPKATVQGHGTRLMFGTLNGVSTACLLGRFHFYEGHTLHATAFPVRVLSRLGIRRILITNAAGSVDPSLRVGDIMVIEDHISFLNLAGIHVLRGENASQLGPRFPAMTEAYHPAGYKLVCEAARSAGISPDAIQKGVYMGVGGPSYETPAEIRMLRMMGGGAVGMSTIPEVVAAVHCGMRVVAFSLITNIGIGRGDLDGMVEKPTHEEVLLATKARAQDIESLVYYLIPMIALLE